MEYKKHNANNFIKPKILFKKNNISIYTKVYKILSKIFKWNNI